MGDLKMARRGAWNDPLLEGIPVVVLPAAEHVQVPGALEVLSKRIDLQELLQVVEGCVRGERDAGA